MTYSKPKKIKATQINNVLYWSGTMLDNAPNLDPQLQATAASGFNNILLWSLHVNTANPSKQIALGDFTWNDTLLVSSQSGKQVFDPTGSFTKLATRLKNLLSKGTVKKIFLSFGAGGTSDCSKIKRQCPTVHGRTTFT